MSNYQKEQQDHVDFLKKKKEEYLASKRKETVITERNSHNTATAKLPFANDGSFMERFKAMQKEEKTSNGATSKKISIQPSKAVLKSKIELKKPASIFSTDNEEVSDSDYDVARKLALKVANEGIQSEAQARIIHQHDSRYRFLFDKSSLVGKFYQDEIRKYKWDVGKKRCFDDSASSFSQQQQSSGVSNQPTSSVSSSVTASGDITAEFERAKALVRAKAAALMSGGAGVAAKVLSEEEKKRQKDIEEQRMMQDIYRRVIEQQVAEATSKSKKRKADKPRYEYDSDEETEGGTWEHKKRTAEMQKTQDWAMDLTSSAKGKHHLADFLPPDELEKFMEQVKAVQEGRDADFSDYAKYRIQDDNIGYKMLQKAGWQEGTGLGAKQEGITQPINKGKTSFDQAGVGAEKPSEIQKDDNEFELYRKRMMLSYKFRPNPLNNPRRPYY